MKRTVLLVEDEIIMRVTLEDALSSAGYDVVSFDNGKSALAALKDHSFDLVVTDIMLPDCNGFDILKEATKIEETQVLVLTAYGTIKDAVDAMRLGAFDYITKPFSLDEFLLLVEKACDIKRLKEENIRLKRDLSQCFGFQQIIGESVEMKKIYSLIGKVAESDSAVLIFGESGTGKELIATTIHYQSKRRGKPLIKVNCAALPEGLVESELFGYEKGAFTGALKTKPGRFELADGGTLFLDEIGDLPRPTQIKLLRVLQDGCLERLGSTVTVKTDVRIITATNMDLEDEIKKGNFRGDLYYRLNVIPVFLPPLRNKIDDIPLLLNYFLERYNARSYKKVKFDSQAVETLMEYGFPGNVRELENIVERCAALSDGDVITKEQLPRYIIDNSRMDASMPYISLSEVAAEAEKEHILKILRSSKGSKTKTAEILGISRKNLWEKLKAYNINPKNAFSSSMDG